MGSILSGKLTGWQITAMVCTALVVPGTLYAAVTFSNVAVVNPSTGHVAVVDPAGSLHTTDIYGIYESNPANKITIAMPQYVSDGCDNINYTIPAGKALILTSMTGDFFNSDGASVSGTAIYSGANCTGAIYTQHFVPMPAAVAAVVDINYEFGSGIAIPAGSLSTYSYSNTGYLYLHGYLVPAGLVSGSSLQSGADPIVQKRGPSAK